MKNGRIPATRILRHPHENEQPFTRSLANVAIPGSDGIIEIREHDSVHEYKGRSISVIVPR